jgi:hypothetical protein
VHAGEAKQLKLLSKLLRVKMLCTSVISSANSPRSLESCLHGAQRFLLVPRGAKRIQKLPTSHRKLTQSEARKMFQAELFLLHFLNHFAAFSSIRLKALEVRKAGGKHALTLKA